MAYLDNASFERFQNEIKKLNKRLEKNGMAPLTYTSSEKEVTYAELRGYPNGYPSFWDKMIMNVWDVKIDAELVIPETGWYLVAVVDHDEHMVKKIDLNANDEELEKFRYYTICDHCKVNRYRKTTIVIKNENGEMKSIGTSCANDFFGHNMNLWLNKMSWYLWNPSIVEGEDDDYIMSRVSSGSMKFPLEDVVAQTNHIMVEDGGYIPATEMLSTKATLIRDFSEYKMEFTNEDIEVAKKVIEWVKNSEGTSNYMFNLRQIVKNGSVGVKSFGLVASMVHAYEKETVRKMNAEKDVRPSEFIGNVGDKKVSFEATYDGNVTFDTDYGLMHIHKFHDNDGNVIVWKTKNNIHVNAGSKIEFVATIKEHNEYNGTKQTVVTRLKENF